MLRRLASVIVSVVLGGTGSVVLATSSASAATLPTVGHAAHAYGSLITLGNGTLRSGPTSLATIACTTREPLAVSGDAAALSVPVVGSVGPVRTLARTYTTTAARNSASSSRIAGINLLGGKVRADAVASSTVARVGADGRPGSGHVSTLVGLVIDGRPIAASVPANTRIPLASFGTITLNQQGRTIVGNEFRAATSALVIDLSGSNPLGLPSGTRIELATSRAYITKPVAGTVGGAGYATGANLGNGTVVSSPQALAYAPCSGGRQDATIASVRVPSLLTTGTTQTHAASTVTTGGRSVGVWSDIANTNVLAGVITARAVNARTSVAQTGTARPTIVDSSRFLGLQVKGAPAINDSVRPNTVLTVPGLGKVTFHKVGRTATAIQLTMIEVVLGSPRGNLPAGAVVRIGYSYSALR